MSSVQSFTTTEFKAKCLDIVDQLAARKFTRVTVTKRGRVVGVLTPPDTDETAVRQLYGSMRVSVILPPDFDLTAPVLHEPFLAETGALHG